MAVDPTMILRITLLTMGSIASAKTISIIMRKVINQIHLHQFRQCQPLLTQLYQKVNAFDVSLNHRQALQLDSDEFTYGEIVFSSFADILTKVEPKRGEIFYDLGCGSGKAVFTTALLYPDIQVRGIEFLEPLYQLCLSLKKQLITIMKTTPSFKNKDLNVAFIQENLITYHVDDADIIFINATCFETKHWEQICQKMELLKPGSRIIMSSKTLESPNFELSHAQNYLMTWGMNSVYIYKKIK